MKKNITINLFGTLYNIDEDACQLLEEYLNSMKNHFKRQEGGEEIADDIEHRVAELLWNKKEEGVEAVSIEIIRDIIKTIGNPAEIDSQIDGEQKSLTSSTTSDKKYDTAYKCRKEAQKGWEKAKAHCIGRKLYRDKNDCILGGVCSGLARYMNNCDPLLIRIILLVLFFAYGLSLIMYIILWILVPVARTPEDRLRMKGIPVTPENLNQEMLNVQQIGPVNNSGGKCLLYLLIFIGIISLIPFIRIFDIWFRMIWQFFSAAIF